MVLLIIRALFVLLMAAIGYNYLGTAKADWQMWVAVTVAVLILALDILTSRKKLLAMSGVLLGLVMGLIIAYGLGYVVQWLVEQYVKSGDAKELIAGLKLVLNVICCYLSISFVMQTKDDIRFVIPYVEFAKQSKGARPMLMDSSVLVDGRVADLAELGMFDCRLVITRFVLDELQSMSDCSDRLKRNRGRRGLDVVAKLQANHKIDILIYEGVPRDAEAVSVDQKLVALSAEMDARILTTDFNLNKVAQLRGIAVINLNELARAMKPAVLPGERIAVQIMRAGEQPGQGVGYLEDGTMVVVEQGRTLIGEAETEVSVTSVVQTSAGRMVFAQVGNGESRRPRRPQIASPEPQAPAS